MTGCLYVSVCECQGSQAAAVPAISPGVSKNTPGGSRMGGTPSRAAIQPISTKEQPPRPYFISTCLALRPVSGFHPHSLLPHFIASVTHFPCSPQGLLPARPLYPLPRVSLPFTCLAHSRLGPHSPLFQEGLPDAAPSTPCCPLPTFLVGALGGSASLRDPRGLG